MFAGLAQDLDRGVVYGVDRNFRTRLKWHFSRFHIISRPFLLAKFSHAGLLDATNNAFFAYSGERDRTFRSIVTAAHEMVLRG